METLPKDVVRLLLWKLAPLQQTRCLRASRIFHVFTEKEKRRLYGWLLVEKECKRRGIVEYFVTNHILFYSAHTNVINVNYTTDYYGDVFNTCNKDWKCICGLCADIIRHSEIKRHQCKPIEVTLAKYKMAPPCERCGLIVAKHKAVAHRKNECFTYLCTHCGRSMSLCHVPRHTWKCKPLNVAAAALDGIIKALPDHIWAERGRGMFIVGDNIILQRAIDKLGQEIVNTLHPYALHRVGRK